MRKMNLYIVFLWLTVCTFLVVNGVIKVNKYFDSAQLCDAIKRGDTQKSLQLIEQIDDVNHYTAPTMLRRLYAAVDEVVRLPLIEACAKGDYTVVKALLEKGADPNMYYKGYFSPIEATSVAHHLERLAIYQILVEEGAEVDLNGSGCTALFNELKFLSYSKSVLNLQQEIISKEVIVYLLQNGANSINDKGNTVAHYLCAANENEFLDKLSFEYELPIDQVNKKQQTPMMWAIQKESIDTVEYLISENIDLKAVDKNGKAVLDYAKETKNEKLISLILNAIETQGDTSIATNQGTVL